MNELHDFQPIVLLFVVPQGGPQGIMMTFKGKPVDITKWKCKTVSNFHEAVTKHRGWHAKQYAAAANWGGAKVSVIKGQTYTH